MDNNAELKKEIKAQNKHSWLLNQTTIEHLNELEIKRKGLLERAETLAVSLPVDTAQIHMLLVESKTIKEIISYAKTIRKPIV